MLARLLSAAVRGIQAQRVTVEVEMSDGVPSWTTVGLADRAVNEGRMRVRAAITRMGLDLRIGRVVVSLSPADLHKDGAAYDLPIALALLKASGVIDLGRLEGLAILGELALDGGLNPIRGVLPIAAAIQRLGLRGVLVPRANAREAAAAGIEVRSANHLSDILTFCKGGAQLPLGVPAGDEGGGARGMQSNAFEQEGGPDHDLADVYGQTDVRRAMEIAAAGGHSVLLTGPPGCGKSMLAQRLPGILPPLTRPEALETTSIHSVAGQLLAGGGLLGRRPFRAPHHTASAVALIGGGQRLQPGEVSLAHNGVLFLDELAEFPRRVLESLRQPLEDGRVLLSRAAGRVVLPARFMLVAAMNLCPCGGYGSSSARCHCSPSARVRYRARVSGPLLDRIDLVVAMQPLSTGELMAPFETQGGTTPERSAVVRERVLLARDRQTARAVTDAGSSGSRSNAELGPADVRRWCQLDGRSRAALAEALRRRSLSARAHHRVLRVARTLADLRGSEAIGERDVLEAMSLRRREESEHGLNDSAESPATVARRLADQTETEEARA